MPIENQEIVDLWINEKNAWDSKDPERIIEARLGSRGYGARNIAWREYPVDAKDMMMKAVSRYYEDIEYLRHVDLDVNSWSEGDVGLVWGFFTEEVKHIGQLPEEMRVRFSCTYVRKDGEWRLLMSHNDIQPFTEDGKYIKKHI
jgi:hypothetical protein